MNTDPEFTHLLPADETDATRRLEAVLGLSPSDLEGLAKDRLLLAWWSFFWLHAALHPDDAEVWPETVAAARPLAGEALRRYEADTLNDGEYTPPKPSATAFGTSGGSDNPLNPNLNQKRIRPKLDRSDRHSRMREGGRSGKTRLHAGASFLLARRS